ncbi:MAG TPA: ABC transporter permease [Pseudolabrys sp.]|nr:ABC transporter permease [Pseudolabrys sp.]
MQRVLALNIPQQSAQRSRSQIALIDILAGIHAINIWARLGWRDTKRRYRRTVFGPFWTTASLALFVLTLGILWANLWGHDPKTYLPYLTAGMVCWSLFSAVSTEGGACLIVQETLIKQLRISYTLLVCATVWRNVIVFFHNLIIYLLVCIYGGVSITWATLLFIPGFILFCANAIWIVGLLGAVCTRYRDIQQLVGSLLQISMFLTPILWTPDQLKGRVALLADLNPLYHLIAIVRDPMLGVAPAPMQWIVVLAITVAGWTLLIRVMTKFRHRIVYWI